jgi:hypothetical protein
VIPGARLKKNIILDTNGNHSCYLRKLKHYLLAFLRGGPAVILVFKLFEVRYWIPLDYFAKLIDSFVAF